MRYLDWKRAWVKTIVDPYHEWLYFPETDRVVTYCTSTGLEVQMTDDYWREFSIRVYSEENKILTVDQKLDKIIKLLEDK